MWKKHFVPRHRKTLEHTQETRLALPHLPSPSPQPPPPPPQDSHHPRANTSPEGRLSSKQQAASPRPPTRPKKARAPKEELSWIKSQPTDPDLLIHSPTHPPTPPSHWGGEEGVQDTAATAGSFPSPGAQCLGGATIPSARAAAPRSSTAHSALQLSPLFSPRNRIRPRRNRD